MNILQISYLDSIGGAARVAQSLHRAYRSRGENAWVAVGRKFSEDPYIRELSDNFLARWMEKIVHYSSQNSLRRMMMVGPKNVGRFLKLISETRNNWNDYWGMEDFDYPATWKLLELPDDPPDIIHAHNLHEKYFDLRYLPVLSHHIPTVITMHDMWLLTGHCAHSFDCPRWKTGCGSCPYLETNPPVKRDATAYNWSRKKEIYSRARLYLVSPSRWLMQKVSESPMFHSVQIRVIPNGVDLSIFYPMSKLQAREILLLPKDVFILLFVAVGSTKNMFKDYNTIQMAIERISSSWTGKKILALALGGDARVSRTLGNITFRSIPYSHDQKMIANYYQAADIYLHAARADTFPNVTLEALACGTPIIATGIGGIPEQISDGQTGFVTPGTDPESMAARIVQLFQSDDLRQQMGLTAATTARANFSLDRMAENYLTYYQEVIEDWQSGK